MKNEIIVNINVTVNVGHRAGDRTRTALNVTCFLLLFNLGTGYGVLLTVISWLA